MKVVFDRLNYHTSVFKFFLCPCNIPFVFRPTLWKESTRFYFVVLHFHFNLVLKLIYEEENVLVIFFGMDCLFTHYLMCFSLYLGKRNSQMFGQCYLTFPLWCSSNQNGTIQHVPFSWCLFPSVGYHSHEIVFLLLC